MSEPFKGTINVDIRDSVPDWAPFEPPRAPDGAPNVVYIVLDDVGFSAMSCYGGPIETPNIDRIAADGVRYTQWHTTALCSPTRSCLLTGRNHTRNSMACITEAAIGFPNASGTIPPENGMLPEILGERGWNTYMVGKWHLCPTVEMNLASTRRNWPHGRGFERWYGFLGAETNQWYPGPGLRQPPGRPAQGRPRDGYHFTGRTSPTRRWSSSRTRRCSRRTSRSSCTTRPVPPTRRTTPRRSGSTSSRARFDMGYEAMREQTLARQKEMGIVPADTELPPINPIGTPETRSGPDGKPFPPWTSPGRGTRCPTDEKRLFSPDGRGVRGIPGARRPPDRAAARLPGGDRAAGEHHGHRGVGQRRQRRGRPERVGQREQALQRHTRRHAVEPRRCSTSWAGPRPTTTTRTGGRWRSTRRSRCGSGTSSTAAPPTRASSPGPRATAAGKGEMRHQYHHAIDIVPTILDTLGVGGPGDDQGPRAEPRSTA